MSLLQTCHTYFSVNIFPCQKEIGSTELLFSNHLVQFMYASSTYFSCLGLSTISSPSIADLRGVFGNAGHKLVSVLYPSKKLSEKRVPLYHPYQMVEE